MQIEWHDAHDYKDIRFQKAEGIARISINRPEVRNAFRPLTVTELLDAFARAPRWRVLPGVVAALADEPGPGPAGVAALMTPPD